MSTTDATELDTLLDFLKRSRGFDFSGYKRASLERRIAKRMDAVGAEDYVAYLDHLELQPDEYQALFDTILINVTSFFRDPQAWEYMAEKVLPDLLAALGTDRAIRVWCAGCASGEETYTLAILLADALGEEAYRSRVKIYATDADEDALNTARAATYPAKAVEAVPPDSLERYFDRVSGGYAFRKDLRRTIIFGRNDLVQDAPISRIDLLTCRNALMYFTAETQASVLRRFHFALNDAGVLFLGKSEMLITHTDLFRPVSLKRRVFTKVGRSSPRDRLSVAPLGMGVGGGVEATLRETAFDVSPLAQVVVDDDGVLAMANRAARMMFGLSLGDVGRALKDLELSHRPVELRASLELASSERRAQVLTRVPHRTGPGADALELDVRVDPLLAGEALLGAAVSFIDVSVQRRLHDELERSKAELESAYEELQSTVEELETTNEELQSTNEELETTNEELQATNEELETMNEELQSTNEELETINDELRERSTELNGVNAFLETILVSMSVAVVVVDRTHLVRVWNDHATELWGLRGDEVVGQHLLSVDIGMPMAELTVGLSAVLAGAEERCEIDVEATDRRGRRFVCHVTCLPLRGDPGQVTGAVVLMDGAATR